MAFITTTKTTGPKGEPLDYTYASTAGVPMINPPAQNQPIFAKQYRRRVNTVIKCGHGVFRMDRTDERHCGRTLLEVLEKLANREYNLIDAPKYEWRRIKGRQVCFTAIMWIEAYHEPKRS